MVKRRREEANSDEETAIEEATLRTVFVDTDLDTHLALVVTDSDTVCDLKKKIMFEHLKCFPEKRELNIFSVKVRRRGHYYYLPDTILVRSAFEGIKKGWFLYAEASSSQCRIDRGLLCLTYPQTEAYNLCPSDSLKAVAKQKVSNTSESHPVHGNLASSSIVKQKEVVKVIGKISQSGTIASTVKKLGSKESSRGSTEVNHRDVWTIAIPQNSTADGPIKAALKRTLEDKSETTDTAHKKKKKKMRTDSSIFHDEVAATGLERINNLVPNADSVIHVTPSGMKEISPVKDRASKKEFLAPVKDFNNINLVGGPTHESNVSGTNEPKTDVANTSGEQKELTPNSDFEVPMNEKLGDASTKDPVPSYQLPNSQGATENNFGGKKRKSKKSTHRHGLDMKNIVDPSQNACASGRDKVRHDGPSDATTKVGSIVQKTDLYHRNEMGKEGKLSNTQGAETSRPSDNNKATAAAIEQILSAEKALDDSGSTDSGKSRSKKCKKKSLKESAEKIPDKLEGEDETRVKCLSLAAGIEPTTDHVSDQSKKGEISLDARMPQISPNKEVEESSHNKDLLHVNAACKSSEYAKKEMTTKAEETVSAIPSDLKVAERHGKSKKKRTKKEVAAHTDDVSGASTAVHNPPANHFVQECNQDKTATCKSSDHAKAEMTTKEVETVSTVPFDLNVGEGHGNSGRSKKRTKKKVTAHTDDVSGAPSAMHTTPGNHLVQESNEDKNVFPSTERNGASEQESKSAYVAGFHLEVEKGASEQESKSAYAADSHQEVEKATSFKEDSLPIEEKGNEVEHLQLKQTDKNQETVSLVEKELIKKTKKSQKASKKSKSTDIQDQEVGPLELAAARSHQEVEKATSFKAEILPIEDKGNEVEHLQLNQTDKNQETVSRVEKELKKKTKKSRKTSKKSKSTDIQDQEVGLLELAAANDNLRDVSPLPAPMEINVSAKNSYVDQLDVTLENQKNPGVDSNSKSSGKDLRNTESFRVPSHPLAKGALEEMHGHEVTSDQSGRAKGEHEPEIDTDENGSINFKQYFIPRQQQSEVSAGKPMKSNKDIKAGRKSKKDRVNSEGTLGNISTSRAEVTVPSPSSAKRHQTLEEAEKLATFDAPAYKRENKEAMDESMSSSSSKGSDRFPENRKKQACSEIQSLATINTKLRAGDLEDCTQPEKGFLPTSGPKFGDSRSRSSGRKGGYSDCSTETPSDYSSSSGYSGEGSEISQASTPKGANGAKHEHTGAKHKVKSNFLSPDVTIDMILRSSSRFKKAKVTAAQCQDEESLPDVVPDSLPNL